MNHLNSTYKYSNLSDLSKFIQTLGYSFFIIYQNQTTKSLSIGSFLAKKRKSPSAYLTVSQLVLIRNHELKNHFGNYHLFQYLLQTSRYKTALSPDDFIRNPPLPVFDLPLSAALHNSEGVVLAFCNT